jgi:hypothetical protein
MEEESEGSSYITTSSLIDAQFHDLIHSDYESEGSDSDLMPKKSKKKSSKDHKNAELPSDDENQDWEWVEETEYVVLDFGGVNLDARDMERLTENGYHLVVRLSFCRDTFFFGRRYRTRENMFSKWSND